MTKAGAGLGGERLQVTHDGRFGRAVPCIPTGHRS